ncbi:hypothetical protein L2E82_40306 [Cichorium intybus]|uniref:Uncharacterized protein n=1 Tax=Cichorium intybus TaxID=13427 RepID=A0ACB9AMC6_CICIN|nr:hypothetical protein L2E82_40306 [Cichorium intybus]
MKIIFGWWKEFDMNYCPLKLSLYINSSLFMWMWIDHMTTDQWYSVPNHPSSSSVPNHPSSSSVPNHPSSSSVPNHPSSANVPHYPTGYSVPNHPSSSSVPNHPSSSNVPRKKKLCVRTGSRRGGKQGSVGGNQGSVGGNQCSGGANQGSVGVTQDSVTDEVNQGRTIEDEVEKAIDEILLGGYVEGNVEVNQGRAIEDEGFE